MLFISIYGGKHSIVRHKLGSLHYQAKKCRTSSVFIVSAAFYLFLLHTIVIVALTKTDITHRVLLKFGFQKNKEALDYIDAQGKYFSDLLKTIKKDSVQIAFIGDSITRALCLDPTFGAINMGIDGDSVSRLSKRINTYTNLEGNFVILAIGVNDLPSPIEKIICEYKYILEVLNPIAKVMISSVLSIDEDSYRTYWNDNKTNAQIKMLNAELCKLSLLYENVYFADTAKYLVTNDQNLRLSLHRGDGIHLNENGYKVWVCALLEEIKEIEEIDAGVKLVLGNALL